jgi:hypothetical protein
MLPTLLYVQMRKISAKLSVPALHNSFRISSMVLPFMMLLLVIYPAHGNQN